MIYQSVYSLSETLAGDPFRLLTAFAATFPKGSVLALSVTCGASSPLGKLARVARLRGYKWRSEKSVKAIAPTGAALAFLCFDFFFRIVKGVQPLTRCGVGGVQR